VKGMENVNFTIFGLWFPCWFQSASSRRPWPDGLAFRRHLRCPRLLGIGILQTPMTDTMVYGKNMAMSSDNMKRLGCDGRLYGALGGLFVWFNRWLSDASLLDINPSCLWDSSGFLGDWIQKKLRKCVAFYFVFWMVRCRGLF